jgi:sulfite exporter TauE/SafE
MRNENRFAAAWFDGWLRVFVAGVVGALAVVALGPITQVAVVGCATLIASLAGALVCAIGLANYDRARWRELASHVTSIGQSLHHATEAIAEPRLRTPPIR